MEHKIRGLAPQFYNVVAKGAGKQCASRACERGKCICMGIEQEELLNEIFFPKMQYSVNESELCQQNKDQPRKLYAFESGKKNEDYDKLLESGEAMVPSFVEWLKLFPVLYYTNSKNQIKDRNTLLYLCVFSRCFVEFTSLFLKELIGQTIELDKKKLDENEKKEYAQHVNILLENLNEMYLSLDSKGIQKELYDAIKVYWEEWKSIGQSRYDNYARELKNYMNEVAHGEFGFREFKNQKGMRNEWRKICFLFEILEEVLRISCIPYEKPKGFLVFQSDMEDESDIRNKENEVILNILGAVEPDGKDKHMAYKQVENLIHNKLDYPF